MSKELTLLRHDFPIDVDCNNCLASSLTDIFTLLYPNLYFDGEEFFRALPETNTYFMVNLFSLLQKNGYHDIHLDTFFFPKKMGFLFTSIVALLEGGGICEIGVKGTPWIEEVLHQVDKDPTDENHSVVIYGYYQPDENIPDGWLYMTDSYSEKKLFVPWQDLFPVIDTYGPKVDLNVFNLAFDQRGLRERYSGSGWIRKPTQRKILKRIPGKSHKEKLAQIVFPRRSASHPQS